MNHPAVDHSESRTALEAWAQQVIRSELDLASRSLAAYCKKPASAKRLHEARKKLARLRSALDDLGTLAGVAGEFRERVHELHKRAGKVRDSDVLRERIAGYCEEAFGEDRKYLHAVDEHLSKSRKKARRKLAAAIASTAPELQG